MFTWPALELTDYEKKFVGVYKHGNKPGVLRRAYEIFMNTVADPLTPGLEAIKLQGVIQIARRSRVFALSFAGNLGSWRLQISTGSGEQMTPKVPGSDGYPIVSSMLSGASFNALSALGDQVIVAGLQTPGAHQVTSFFGNSSQGPLLIDPNWELASNESLFFDGTAIDNQSNGEFSNTPPAQKLLSIVAHVWEFPNMDGKSKRHGAGPQLSETDDK